MKMIRWSGFIAFVVIVGLITAFNLFFLDSIIKGALEKRASLIVGARVDIGDLAFKIFGLHIDIRTLQVTNPDQPMRNTVETGTISFDLAAGPLLKKKIVIEKMGVNDLAFNTARKTSGALPARLQKKLKTTIQPLDVSIPAKGRLEECVLPNFAMLADLKKRSPEDLLGDVKLKSSDFLADYRKKISKTRQSWEKRLQELPSKESLEADLKSLQELMDQRPEDITQLPAYIEKINALRQRVNTAQNSLIAARKDFQAEIGNLRTALSQKELGKLKNRDLKDVMARLDIKIPSTDDLVCVLVGKNIAKKVNYAIAWYRKLNDFMPAGKTKAEKQKPRTVPRMKGVDVRFPITDRYPDFLVEKAVFSARPALSAEPGKLVVSDLSGKLEGLTTQPAIYGRPALFNLKGSLAGGKAKEIILSGILDHRGTPTKDTINLIIEKLRLQPEDSVISDKLPLQLTSAYLNVNSNLQVSGENLKGRVLLIVRKPEVTVESEASILAGLFKNIGTFDVGISIAGTLDQPSMTLSSSLTKTLESRFQSIVQKEMGGLQNNLKKAIASRLDKDLKEGSRDTDTLEKSVLDSLADRLNIAGLILKKKPGTAAPGDKTKPADLLKKNLLPFSL
ncbi:MAG: TIGR03545 family protein [Thermodesulfobacteriota bacterium]|nr:TIGR03545 family protein [Thermodesulfobacteriota bacterium]